MVVVRNLEVAHHINGNVQATRVIAHSVDNGTQHSCLSSYAYQPFFPSYPNIATHELKRLSLPHSHC